MRCKKHMRLHSTSLDVTSLPSLTPFNQRPRSIIRISDCPSVGQVRPSRKDSCRRIVRRHKSSRQIVDELKKDSIKLSKSSGNKILTRRSEVFDAAGRNLPSSFKRLRFSASDEEHRRLDEFVYERFLCPTAKAFPI